MRQIWNSFLIAFSMFSKIPVPRAQWEKENMKYMFCFFPAIGLVIGAFVYLYGKLCLMLEFGSLLQTVGFLLIPILISGGIHLDGFLDTVDALNSYQPRERKLEILKDSHAGAFAIIMAMVYFLCSLGVWSEIEMEALPILACSYALSRTLSAVALTTFPCANKNGSLGMFADAAQKRMVQIVLLLWFLLLLFYAVSVDGKLAVCLFLGAMLSYLYYYYIAMKEFGGTTGDIAGFFVQLSELVMAFFVMIGGKLL